MSYTLSWLLSVRYKHILGTSRGFTEWDAGHIKWEMKDR